MNKGNCGIVLLAQWYDKGISHKTHGEAILRKIDSRLKDIAVHLRTRQRETHSTE